MKTLSVLLSLIVASFALNSAPLLRAQDNPTEVHKFNWPRTFSDGTTTLSIYQPDIEKWDGNAFEARSAVSVQAKDQQAPTFGVVWLTARTDVDKSAGIVTLSDLQFTKANFPTEPDQNDALLAAIRKQVPTKPLVFPLAQVDNTYLLQNALQKTAAQPVDNTPPAIIFSNKPALLILISGDPVMRPIPDTPSAIQRVFNTQALILQVHLGDSGAVAYYLRAMKYWYKSSNMAGPWVPTEAPKGVVAAGKAAVATKQVNPIDPPDGKDRPSTPPVIFVSTTPAELVQTQGEPQFVPIPETQLLEVKNSDNAIILNIGDQNYYVLISGRWFKSTQMTGPWTYVNGAQLPPDFAKIPPDSDKANVLVSVPNTPQAQEAVIANSIPQTATVKRSEAKVTVDYDGQPQFAPIADTPLSYAVNTPLPVIEVQPNAFFCVANGIWFTAAAPTGPWAVATSVPPVIYSIPVSSPVHYVTYVRVYGSTPEVVYVGYTPGYYGTVVTPDGVVVYGTGYYYPAYVGTTVYVAPPATYGYGAGFADGAATGFAVGFIAGAVLGACLEPHYGCWGWGGGWGNTYNVNINNTNVYNHWGNTAVVNHSNWTSANGAWHGSNGAAGFNPYTGNWGGARSTNSYNPNTGVATHTGGSASGNAYTGNWNANQNKQAYGPNGGHAQSNTTASGNAYNGTYNSTTTKSGETGNGAKAGSITTDNNGSVNKTGAAYNPNTGNGAVWHNGNVYTGNDGNVYKKSDNGTTQQYGKSGWQDTQRSSANESQMQSVDRQSQGWDKGNDRYQQQASGGRWGGGGQRGGGGGGGFHRR